MEMRNYPTPAIWLREADFRKERDGRKSSGFRAIRQER
jgi:hypothetical protein